MQTTLPGRVLAACGLGGSSTPPVSGSSNLNSAIGVSAGARFTLLGHCVELAQLPGDFIPMYKDSACRWQHAHQRLAVSLCDYAWIGDHHCAAIGCRADQSSEPLLQSKCCVRHHVFRERVSTALGDRLAVRRREGLGRDAEGELRDEKSAQCMSRYVYPFPIRRRAEQHSAPGYTGSREKRIGRCLAMNEKRPIGTDSERAKLHRRLANIAVAGEQHEDSTVSRGREFHDHLDHRAKMPGWSGVRRRSVFRHSENCLSLEIER